MNEKKFSKKLNDMTPEEKQRKDALWQKISLESGIDVGEKKIFSLRLTMTLAMCVFVLLIAIPLVVVNLNSPIHQAGGSMTSFSQGDTSFNSTTLKDDPNKFKDNEFIYVASTKTIEEIAKDDSNILYVKDWERKSNVTTLIKEVNGEKRIIGVVDKSLGKIDDHDYEINVNIIYEDISIESIDKAIKDMKTKKTVNGIDVSWRSKDSGGCASFVYNKYTYYIEINGGTSSGEVAFNAAQTLLTTK